MGLLTHLNVWLDFFLSLGGFSTLPPKNSWLMLNPYHFFVIKSVKFGQILSQLVAHPFWLWIYICSFLMAKSLLTKVVFHVMMLPCCMLCDSLASRMPGMWSIYSFPLHSSAPFWCLCVCFRCRRQLCWRTARRCSLTWPYAWRRPRQRWAAAAK